MWAPFRLVGRLLLRLVASVGVVTLLCYLASLAWPGGPWLVVWTVLVFVVLLSVVWRVLTLSF